MADSMVLFVSPVHGMLNASGIMYFYAKSNDMLVGVAGAATTSAEAGHAALHEHFENFRFDILVCFGKTWKSVACATTEGEINPVDAPPEAEVYYQLVHLFGQAAPTILLTVPSAASGWWEEEDNVLQFMRTLDHLVSNRIVALNSNLSMLQYEEAWPWN